MRPLNLIYESTRECLLIRVERRWSSAKVIGALADTTVRRRVSEHLRSDNGLEFLNSELFYSLKEMRVLAERWRVHYNTVRPHSSL